MKMYDESEPIVVICAFEPAPQFSDCVEGECQACGKHIVWRPHAPEPSIKLCVPCGHEMMNMAEADGIETEVVTTPRQVEEMEKATGIRGAVDIGHIMMEALRRWPKEDKDGDA
jgi:hypothetical protein